MVSERHATPATSADGPQERESVLNPRLGQSRISLLAFGVLASIYLMTFGPVTWELAPWVIWWTAAVVGHSALVMTFEAARAVRGGAPDPPGGFLAALNGTLATVILLPALVHGIALELQPSYQSMNVSGVAAGGWISQHWYFASIYLLFPVLLVCLYLLLDRLRLEAIGRIVAVGLALSIAVQYYQGLVDWSFLNNWMPGSKRTGGLATDPNAYQLVTFLLAPLLIALALLDRRGAWALFASLVAALAIGGLFFSGGRTAIGGIALLLLLSPLILAVAMRQWSRPTRWLLAASPFVVFTIGVVVLPHLAEEIRSFGPLGWRIADSIERFSSGGFHGLLFDREARGQFWQSGWVLLWEAPLAGWGAGGFLREYPTEVYLRTGTVPTWIDYVGNHYLMIPIDLGIPALLIQLTLIGAALFVGFRALRYLNEPRVRLALTTLLASQSVFLLMIVVAPPYFPDAIYAWTLNLALLFVIAKRVGVVPLRSERIEASRRKAFAGVLGALAVVAVIGSYGVSFGSQGYRARLDAEGSPLRYERNCYGIEQQGETRWRWCGHNGRVKLPIVDKALDEIVVRLSAGNPDLGQNPLVVRYGGLTGPRHELVLGESPSAEIRLPLNAGDVVEVPRAHGSSPERFAVLSVDPSRTWVPKEWGVNEDTRELGVLVELPAVRQ